MEKLLKMDEYTSDKVFFRFEDNKINLNDPCADCPNNLKNNPHASGICHCALPSMKMLTW